MSAYNLVLAGIVILLVGFLVVRMKQKKEA